MSIVRYRGAEYRETVAKKIGYGLPEKLQWPPYRWEIFAPPFQILREGVMCYINGFYNSFALMARSSVETAIYLSLSIDIYADETKPEKTNFSFTDERDWGKVLSEAVKRHYITKKEIKDIDFIRAYGNLIAHWGQKVHNASRSIQIPSSSVKGADPFTFARTVPTVNLAKFWISEAKATTILRKNVSVLKALANRV